MFSLCTVALMIGFASMAQAQDRPYDDKGELWWTNLNAQLAEGLKSPIRDVKVQTMRHIIFFAANYPDKADMRLSVPQLLDIYDNDDKEELRVLALAAIDAIGEDYAMRYLVDRVEQERSAKVERLTRSVLAAYYNGGDAG
jgi:hypothetical protein